MRPSRFSPWFSLLVVGFAAGCTTTNVVDTTSGPPAAVPPVDAPAACTADASALDLEQLPVDAAVASTVDAAGTAAIWYAGDALHFGRFGDDGGVLADAAIAPEANLPWANTRSLSIASLGTSYVIGYGDTVHNSVHFRIVDSKGGGGTAKVLNPGTRTLNPTLTGSVTADALVLRRSGDGFVAKWNENMDYGGSASANAHESYAVIQMFDASGTATTKQAAAYLEQVRSSSHTDAVIVGDRFAMIYFEQGERGSIGDLVPHLSQAAATSDLSTWNEAKVLLPKPPALADVTRTRPTILPSGDGGTVMTDLARYDVPGSLVYRLEIAWLDALGAVTKTASVDIPPAEAHWVADPTATIENGTLYVGWVSAMDEAGMESPSLHLLSIAADGTKSRADAELKFPTARGQFDSLTRTLRELVVGTDGTVRLGYVWMSWVGSGTDKTQHLATHTFCLPAHATTP